MTSLGILVNMIRFINALRGFDTIGFTLRMQIQVLKDIKYVLFVMGLYVL